jgi:hypothetical protein
MYPYMATTDENGQWVVRLHGDIKYRHHDMAAAVAHAQVLNDALVAAKLLALEVALTRS